MIVSPPLATVSGYREETWPGAAATGWFAVAAISWSWETTKFWPCCRTYTSPYGSVPMPNGAHSAAAVAGPPSSSVVAVVALPLQAVPATE